MKQAQYDYTIQVNSLMPYINENIDWERKYEETHLENGEIWFGILSEDNCHQLQRQHSIELINCYIDPIDLSKLAEDNGIPPSSLFQDEILPDLGHIKSGDSGEILTRSVLQERDDQPTIPTYRWRNKSHKNDTVRGPDLLGYVMQDGDDPSENDVLVIAEVKTRSTTVNPDVVLEAFDDALKHYISKLANSLIFIQQWLIRQGDEQEATRFARFFNPHELPYRKRLNPCVVHNHATWQDEFIETLPPRHELDDSVRVIIIAVDNLPDWIDEIFREAVRTLETNNDLTRD